MTNDNYFVWRRETEKEFQAITSTEELKTLIQTQVVSLGFDSYSFLIQHPVPFTRPRIFCIALTRKPGLNAMRKKTITLSIQF